MTNGLIRGAWLDLRPSIALRDETLESIGAMRLDEIGVMIDGPKPGLTDQSWSLRDLERFAVATRGTARIVTCWGTPTHAATAELRDKLPEIVMALEAHEVETDDEEQIDRGSDYASIDAWAGARSEAILGTPGVRRHRVTLYPARLKRSLPIVRRAHVLLDQVYPVDRRRQNGVVGSVTWSSRLGPERFPREALATARRLLDDGGAAHVELAAGLAAYHQEWAGRARAKDEPPVDELAMSLALRSARAAGAQRVWWWSIRHLLATERRAAWSALWRPERWARTRDRWSSSRSRAVHGSSSARMSERP